MKKITITNAYTWYNKGDSGILLGTVDLLKNIYGNDLEIDILSLTPDEDKIRYCKDSCIKNVYSNILNPRPYKHTFFGKIFAVIKLLFKLIYIQVNLFFRRNKKLIKKYNSINSIKNSDLVIVCGGGFLGGNKLDSFIHIFQIYIDTIFSDNVIVLGTSVEPMTNKLVKKYTEKVLKRVNYIFAREEITYNLLLNFVSENKVKLIPDMAFMLKKIDVKNNILEKLKKQNKVICGLTVRNWNFPNQKNQEQLMENYINSVVSTIDYYAHEKNIQFVFIPQVIVSNGNDIDVAKIIKSKLKNKDSLVILDDDYAPGEIKGIISHCDIFLGTRMHSNIFATSSSVPTVAIAYEKKTNGIMHTVSLDDYVIEINTIDFEQIKNKMDRVLDNKDIIRKSLDEKIPVIQNEILLKVKERIGE